MMKTKTVKVIGVATLVAFTAVGAMAAAKKDTQPGSGNAQETHAPPNPVQAKPSEVPNQTTVPSASAKQASAEITGPADRASVAADSASYTLDAAALSTGAAIGDSSASYRLDWTVGELAVGEGASPSYRMDIGVWYLGSWHFCSCPFQCDYDEDGFLTSLDLASLIDVLFAGVTEITDPNCPTSRGDFDCDGFPTSLDLGSLIDHLFAGGDPPCDPCSP